MMYSKSLMVALALVTAVVGVVLAAPKDDVSEMNNEIIPSGVTFTKNGESASASWGGFHASASLADDGSSAVASAGGNGLGGAGAGYGVGGAGAGAGLYGTGAASSAGIPSKPASGGYGNGGKPGGAGGPPLYYQGGPGNGFFDRIFAIPINVLQSVNTYLNQKQLHHGQPGSANGHGASTSASSSASTGGGNTATYGAGDKSPGAAATSGADYGHGDAAAASGHGKPGAPMMIPITALRSVQNLLNG